MLEDKLDINQYPNLKKLSAVQLSVWPDHLKYLHRSFSSHDEKVLGVLEQMAILAIKLGEGHLGGLEKMCQDYRFVCEKMILEEELYFRRHGTYRLSTYKDAYAEVYSKQDLMASYMNGLLLSGIFWANHAKAHTYYIYDFLPQNKEGYKHLEVGCGHGLLIYFAAKDSNCGSVTGWDISTASLAATKKCLDIIGVERKIELKQQNVFEAANCDERFDSIVISEVLEHTEDPEAGLKALYHVLKPGGRIWVNLPLNSPAPDHIYLLRKPEEVTEMVENAGFKILDHRLFPLTGYTEEQARKHSLTINSAVIASRAA
jgi:2-polyprenyl-3-methyl-5-hydroxy-6-metoxy-1,4-benzoquinol methylase